MSELQFLALDAMNRLQQKSATVGKTSRLRIFTESGTWTCPAPGTEVFALVIGGGGAGAIASGISPAGGASYFGETVAAGGDGGLLNSSNITFYITPVGGFFGFGGGGVGSNNMRSVGKPGGVTSFYGNVDDDVQVTVGNGGAGQSPGAQGAVFVFWIE